MLTRRFLLASAAALALATPALAEDKLKVIATFSILGDIVDNVGGDRVEVTTLVGPDGDAHVFPALARGCRGGGQRRGHRRERTGLRRLDGPLVEASGTKATVITAAESVTPIAFGEEEHGHEEGHDHGPCRRRSA